MAIPLKYESKSIYSAFVVRLSLAKFVGDTLDSSLD